MGPMQGPPGRDAWARPSIAPPLPPVAPSQVRQLPYGPGINERQERPQAPGMLEPGVEQPNYGQPDYGPAGPLEPAYTPPPATEAQVPRGPYRYGEILERVRRPQAEEIGPQVQPPAGPYRWGALAYPGVPLEAPQPSPVDEEMLARELEGGDPNLRSARDVMGYYINATDGDIGHVEDFLIDDETWALRYIIVDTRNWLPGRRVLVSPDWIKEVSWQDSKVYVDLSKRHIEAAPEFDPSMPLDREHEERLYDYLGRSKYWEREPRRKVS